MGEGGGGGAGMRVWDGGWGIPGAQTWPAMHDEQQRRQRGGGGGWGWGWGGVGGYTWSPNMAGNAWRAAAPAGGGEDGGWGWGGVRGGGGVYLEPKHGWQCMTSGSAGDLGSVKKPLLVAVQLHHIQPISAVVIVEVLPSCP